jgi:transposase
MRYIREILFYRLEKGVGATRTARALKVSKGTVINTVKRFRASGLSWPLPSDMSDSAIEQLLYPPSVISLLARDDLPDPAYVERELARKHMTLQRLYEEYVHNSASPVSRASFYRYYRRMLCRQPSMPMEYKGGDLVYVDYSGDGLYYTDMATGEYRPVDLFCCCWGLSSYSYAEATETQKGYDYTYSHVHAYQYFGVSPHGVVPDNCTAAVQKSSPFDPVLNPLYAEMARHYGIAVLPARVRKPKDKAKVESAVLHLQRFILAKLRNRQFFSLAEINEAIAALLEEFNARPMKDYGNMSRRARFERLDRPHAQALPTEPFLVTDVAHNVLVRKNYHIRYKDHFYSVPFQHAGVRVSVRCCGGMVEIYLDGQHLSRHRYSSNAYGYTTAREHMPDAHQFTKGLSPGWIIARASHIGTDTVNAVTHIMQRSKHEQLGLRAALGVLRLGRVYTPQRLEAACSRCLHYNTVTYRALKAVLVQKLDKQTAHGYQRHARAKHPPMVHENLRRDFTTSAPKEHTPHE